MFEDKVWVYKRHLCRIAWDCDSDGCNAKAFHTIVTPDDEELWADLNPYDGDKELVELWIDADYPERTKAKTNLEYYSGPFSKEQLRGILKAGSCLK